MDAVTTNSHPPTQEAVTPPPTDPAVPEPVRVGVIGCGDISTEYLHGCAAFGVLDVVACADVDLDRAQARAREHGVPTAVTPDALLADPEIELVVNLTPPAAHGSVIHAAVAAGKHVYSEKPLAHDLDLAREVLAAGRAAGVRIACAPDTVLGGGLQTCRKLIDDGWIGQPLAATAFVPSHGYEHFHPRVDYYYARGGGPMLDVGPYYVTALVHLLGPIARVSGAARRSSEQREVPAGGDAVRRIPVEVPTHVAGTLEFESGAIGSIVASWDVWGSELPYLEIYGTHGSLSVPNPDLFGGDPRILRPGARELEDDPPRDSTAWRSMPLTHRGDVRRGIGVADLAHAIRGDYPHRLSGEVALHVLEALMAFERSSEAGAHVAIESPCARPAPLAPSLVGSPIPFAPPAGAPTAGRPA